MAISPTTIMQLQIGKDQDKSCVLKEIQSGFVVSYQREDLVLLSLSCPIKSCPPAFISTGLKTCIFDQNLFFATLFLPAAKKQHIQITLCLYCELFLVFQQDCHH